MTDRPLPGKDDGSMPAGMSSVLHGSRTLGHRPGLADEAAASRTSAQSDAAVEETRAESEVDAQTPAVAVAPAIARRVAPARAEAAATAVAAARTEGRAVLTMARTRAAAGPQAASSGELGPRHDDGDPPAPERPRPVLRRGTVGPLHVAQLVCWQVAVLAVFLVLDRPPTTLVPVSVAAATAVLLSVVRVRGRVAAQWLWLAVCFVARRPAPVATAAQEIPELLPSALLPGSVIGTLELDGASIGILEHPRGVTVVFSPEADPEADAAGEPVPRVSPVALLRAVPVTGPPATVQLVSLTTAAPPDDDEGVAARAYRELVPARPAYQGVWLALQVLRTADRWSDDDIAQSVGGLLRRVLRRLADNGDRLVPVGPDDLAEVFAAVARVHRPGAVAESWRAWQVPQESQVTYQVLRWPTGDADRAAALLDAVALAPGAATVVSLAARRQDERVPSTPAHTLGDLEIEASVRVCALPGALLDDACDATVSGARDVGAVLRRCDGRQRAGVIATSPFGGFSG